MSKRPISFIVCKVLCLQIFFFIAARLGANNENLLVLFLGLAVMFINFYFVRNLVKFGPYLALMCLFFFTGLFQDTLLIHFRILPLESTFPPLWFCTLWMVFLAYYGDVFNKMLDFPLWAMATLGALGGSFAYYRGLKLMGIDPSIELLVVTAFVWSVFMPITLKAFKYFVLQKQKVANG